MLERCCPASRPSAGMAMGITGFTLATMYRWIRSDLGRAMTMHPFMRRHYTGSGQARAVIAEAGLDGESQFRRDRGIRADRPRLRPGDASRRRPCCVKNR